MDDRRPRGWAGILWVVSIMLVMKLLVQPRCGLVRVHTRRDIIPNIGLSHNPSSPQQPLPQPRSYH